MPTSPEIGPNTRLALSDGAISTAIPGEIVILDPESGQYFGLDGVGARAWELLKETSTLEAMVRTISSEYDVDTATCERDLRALLSDLSARGLIRVGDTPT
jgi:hypothetical protein